MEVNINGEVYEYESDFPDGWRFSRGDYFKFPVVIGDEKCFIKRFERWTEKITGWNLLQSLAEELFDKPETLSKVYDTASVVEDDKIVHYVFFEFIEGQTLQDYIAEREALNLSMFAEDLFASIQTLQINGHWFPDFCEKNIFRNEQGHFLLIDLDSTYPTADLPDNDMWGCKDYWILVINFYTNILHYKDFLPAHLNGASFNYLHVVFLILRLKIYYDNDETEYDTLFEQLPVYLNDISPSFNSLFAKVYQHKDQPLSLQEIAMLKELVLKKVVCTPTEEPLINTFEVANYIKNTDDKYLIANGEGFELVWNTENASNVELYRNGKPYETFNSQQKSIALTEHVYDDTSKTVKYTLIASNSNNKAEQSLTAEIIFKRKTDETVPPLLVRINDFSVRNNIKKNGNQYTVESNQPFTLQWDVENAQKIKLYRNEDLYKEFNKGENNVELKEVAHDGKVKQIDYTLVATNNYNNQNESVEKAFLKVHIIYQKEAVKQPEKLKDNTAVTTNIIESDETPKRRNRLILIAGIIIGLLVVFLLLRTIIKPVPDSKQNPVTKTPPVTDTQTIIAPVDTAEVNDNVAEATVLHNYTYYDSLGNEYARKGDYNEAIKSYDSSIQMNGRYAKGYYNRGRAKYSLKQYNQAIDDLTKAIQLNPSDANAYYQRGLAESKTDKTNNACTDFQKSCNLGYYNGCKQYDQFCKVDVNYFEEAINYNKSGVSKFNSGNYKGAIEDYTKAIQLDSQQSLFYRNRGNAKAALYNYKGAIEDYTKAIQLEPKYAGVYYLRGLAELKMYDKERACKDFNESCNLGDKNGCEAYTSNCR